MHTTHVCKMIFQRPARPPWCFFPEVTKKAIFTTIKVLTIVSLLSAVLVAAACTQLANRAFALALGPDYMRVLQQFVSATHGSSNNYQMVRLSLSTEGNVPTQADDFIKSHFLVGFAWADIVAGKIFAVTIHPATRFDPYLNIWHTHIMSISGGQTYPNDYCIASIGYSPDARISLTGNTLSVQISRGLLPFAPEEYSMAVGFILQPDSGCKSGLAMQIST